MGVTLFRVPSHRWNLPSRRVTWSRLVSLRVDKGFLDIIPALLPSTISGHCRASKASSRREAVFSFHSFGGKPGGETSTQPPTAT